MQSRLDRAVCAGIIVQELHTDARFRQERPTSEQSEHAAPKTRAPAAILDFASPERSAPSDRSSLPLYRRVAARALRALKPLAGPFLHRLDLRTRFAVDHSETADTVRKVHGWLEHQILPCVIKTLPGQITSLATEMSAMAEMTRQTQAVGVAQSANIFRLEAQTCKIDALRSDLDELRSDLDAVREATERLARGKWLETIAKSDERSELLVKYTELLLQRYTIPLGRDFAVRTDAGYLMLPSEDPALLISVVESRGRLEPGTLSLVLSLLPEGGLFVDVGASIGTLTLPAARNVGPCGNVVALEPAPRIAALLRRSIALNDLTAVVALHECAAGEAERTAELAMSALTTHNSFWPPDDTVEVISVPVRPLDTLLAPDRRVDVVKIDVEGAELQVWRGMQRILAQNPNIAVVLEFGPEHLRRTGVSVKDWFAELTASELVAWEIDEATGSVWPLRSAGLEEVFSLNILLMRDPPERRGLRKA